MDVKSPANEKCFDTNCLWYDYGEDECFAGSTVWNYCVFRAEGVVKRRKKD